MVGCKIGQTNGRTSAAADLGERGCLGLKSGISKKLVLVVFMTLALLCVGCLGSSGGSITQMRAYNVRAVLLPLFGVNLFEISIGSVSNQTETTAYALYDPYRDPPRESGKRLVFDSESEPLGLPVIADRVIIKVFSSTADNADLLGWVEIQWPQVPGEIEELHFESIALMPPQDL